MVMSKFSRTCIGGAIVGAVLMHPPTVSAGILNCLPFISHCDKVRSKSTPTPTPTAASKVWRVGKKVFDSYDQAQVALQAKLAKDIDTIFRTLLGRLPTDQEKAQVAKGITVDKGYTMPDLTNKAIQVTQTEPTPEPTKVPQPSLAATPLPTATTLAAQATPPPTTPSSPPPSPTAVPTSPMESTSNTAIASVKAKGFGFGSLATAAILVAVFARPLYRLFRPEE